MPDRPIAERYNIFGLEYFQQVFTSEEEYPENRFFLHEIDLFATLPGGIAPETYYQQAGLKSILAVLLDILTPESIDSIYFEFAKLTASDSDQAHLDFACYWSPEPQEACIRRELVNRNLRPLYGVLKEKDLDIFYHRGFFSFPNFPTCYLSSFEQVGPYTEDPAFQTFREELIAKWEARKEEKQTKEDQDDVGLEQIADTEWGGDLWVRQLPYTDLSYTTYLEQSHNKDIPLPEKYRAGIRANKEKGVRYLHGLLHASFNHCFLQEDKQKENTWLFSIPLLGPASRKGIKKKDLELSEELAVDYEGQGAIIVYLKTKEGVDISLQTRERLASVLANVGKDITYNYLLAVGLEQANIVKEKTKLVKEQALRSAFAGIISRNGSHNLGSHVISSVLSGYQDLSDLHNLLNYIQERFDYLALVSTDFPVWTYPVYFINDLMHRFFKQRLLLNTIADTENITAIEYQKRFLKHNAKNSKFDYENVLSPDTSNKLILEVLYVKDGKSHSIISASNKQTRIEHDVQIAVPGGIIGYQAFFMILENMIRNSSKYGIGSDRSRRKNKPLRICIEIEEFSAPGEPKKLDDFVEVRIWDNVSEVDSINGKLVQDMNKKLVKAFIQEDGEANKADLGLAEMRIAAGFLNIKSRLKIGGTEGKSAILYKRRPPEKGQKKNINQRGYDGFIKAYAQAAEGKYFLGYKFPIPKPKDVLIVGNHSEEFGQKIQETTNQNRVYQQKEVGESPSFHDSDFLVVDGHSKESPPLVKHLLETLTTFQGNGEKEIRLLEELDNLPGRIFIISDRIAELLESPDQQGAFTAILRKRIVFLHNHQFLAELNNRDDFYLFLYQKWIEHLKGLRFGEVANSLPLLLSVKLSGAEASIGKTLFQLTFDDFSELIVHHLLPIQQSEAATEPHLETDHSEERTLSHQLLEVSFEKIAFVLKSNKSWTAKVFVKSWFEVAQQNGASLSKESVKELRKPFVALFSHYLTATRSFYHKYQEKIETLPQVYQAQEKGIFGHEEVLEKFHKKLNEEVKESDSAELEQHIMYQRHDRPEPKRGELIYGESLSGTQIYFSLLNNLPEKEYEQKKLLYQLVENGLLRVAILDERVFKYCEENEEVRERLLLGNIVIPFSLHFDKVVFSMEELSYRLRDTDQEVIGVYDQPLREQPEQTEDHAWKERLQLASWSLQSIEDFDVLIFHQGILDKIFQEEKKHNKHAVRDFIRKCKLKTPYVVITSGRGEPDNLPAKTKFIPYSNIQSMIMQSYPEKLLFTQILMKVSTTEKQSNPVHR